MAFNYSTNLTEGTIDLGTGAYLGTKGYNNTPPSISSGDTASVTLSNLNYRKRSATRYDDLVFWYAFDEAQGSTATDYSAMWFGCHPQKHDRRQTRIGGKIGRGLSFNTPSTKTSNDSNGQYLDLGTWSFGGAHSIVTWVKAEEWRSGSPLLFLAGGDQVALRYSTSNQNALLALTLDGTINGHESYSSDSGLLQWGQWVHPALLPQRMLVQLIDHSFLQERVDLQYFRCR